MGHAHEGMLSIVVVVMPFPSLFTKEGRPDSS